MLTQERLRELLDYDPETGAFHWRISPVGSVKAGSVAGCVSKYNGYRKIEIAGRKYAAHRLAVFYMTGEWPQAQVDHRHRVKDDNRIGSLREATCSQNQANAKVRADNTSGFKGVSQHRMTGRWQASISVQGKRLYLGLYDTPEAAHHAYRIAAIEHFGAFAKP